MDNLNRQTTQSDADYLYPLEGLVTYQERNMRITKSFASFKLYQQPKYLSSKTPLQILRGTDKIVPF